MKNENPNHASGQQTINIQVPSPDNIASRRPLIPASFALAIILFFFTFCDFKCGGQKISSVTGINLVTGTELKDHDMFTGRETIRKGIPANMWAILAFGAAIIGLGAYLIKAKREELIGTGTGAIGAGSLIILQFVIKSRIDKEAKGQIDVDFQFPFWGALIALVVGGLISYLRMKKTHNIVVSVAQPKTSSSLTVENLHQPQATFSSVSQTSSFEIGEWLGKNKKVIIGVLSSAIVLYVGYYFFLRHDPFKDAKQSAASYCECSTKYNDAMIKAYEEFVKSFDSYGFKIRQEARSKLQELQTSVNNENATCQSAAQQKYNELRNRYITEQEMLSKFDFAYNAQSGSCNPSNQSKLTSMYSKVESKISTIKDPEPNIEKIKSDIIGQRIPGWNFSYLNEFKSADIINTTRGSDRIEYQIKFHLRDDVANSEHDCEVMTVYLRGDQGWYFNNMRMLYITHSNTAQVGTWRSVTPLKNCSYEIIDNGQKYWVQDGAWGNKYKGGPDGDQFYLRSSQINIASREDHPIDLIFKYTPNN
ncbi:MAG: hypothetical protein KBA16_06360 [Bacteroidia bacterium]|nr:hypothetical protein [Bacteroidia bacterium]MBP7437325.1 hypothetical protein [Bacteroidia bacterium]MBP7728514.1 hypothetical protein [Bacteroidia bacterium]MBP7772439.1 hypothetical protein [Bacteroidia bacterium]